MRMMLDADSDTPNVYAAEAYGRFLLDLVQDREALDGASADRIRENFRALVRGLELNEDEEVYEGSVKNQVCLVLTAEKVEMLANLHFEEYFMENYKRLSQLRV